MSAERRDYFRIECPAIVSMKAVETADEAEKIRHFVAGNASTFSLAADFTAKTQEGESLFKRIAAISPDVAQYLSGLEHRLQLMATVLVKSEVAESDGQLYNIDLSGNGLAVQTRHAFPLETLVELRLVLLPKYTGLDILARVKRTRPIGEGLTFMGMRFEQIREADHELVIRHVVQKQAEALRAAKYKT